MSEVYAQDDMKAPEVNGQPKEELIGSDGKPTRAGWRKIGEQLRREMPAKSYPGPGGRPLTYITARQVQDRLDAVVGPGNWQTEYRPLDGNVVECTLTLFGVSKADVGYCNEPGKDRETEPLKAAYSDAFKRAAVAWGIGRFLYGDAEPAR